MPLGELAVGLIGEIFKAIFAYLAYHTGFIFLKFISLGQIKLASVYTLGQKGKSKSPWYSWDSNIYYSPRIGVRQLRAEYTCLTGVLIWFAIGFTIYFLIK